MSAPPGPRVRVVAGPSAAVPLLLAELCKALETDPRALVGLATGATFAPFLRALGADASLGVAAATHLDEYEGFPPARRGGMVHELFAACPLLRDLHARGAFAPVPHVADAAAIAAHERILAAMGGVALQFVGLGRNGHVAFHEPGVPLATGFHVATLAESTRADARARFLPEEPPMRAITAGVATILRARRIVLCAFGEAKAKAVRAALAGPVAPACPASGLRAHPGLSVLLDRDAASLLPEASA